MHLYYYHENVLLIKTMKHSTKMLFFGTRGIDILVGVDRINDISAGSHNHHSYATVVPATNDHLRFGAKVSGSHRDINTAKMAGGTLQNWPAKSGGRSPTPANHFFHFGGVGMIYSKPRLSRIQAV